MNEIIRLHEMLNEANIPHTFTDDMFEHRITYPSYQIVIEKDGNRLCDAVCLYGSYGYHDGLLEIMGGLTEEEREIDKVLGYLTADEVFKRFKYCYENNTSLYKEELENEHKGNKNI